MGNRVSTSHRFVRFTRRRRVRKEPPTMVEEPVGGRKNREDTGSENSHSVRAFLSLERQCEKHEEIGERTNRMEEVKTSGKTVEKKVEEEIESIVDDDDDSECSASLREFLMLERLCEEYVEAEEKMNRIEEKNRSVEAEEKRKVEEEIESKVDDDDDSECSASLREFLMLERLCEEYEEAKQRRTRREQEKVEMGFRKFRDHLSTIEEEDDDEEEEVEDDDEEVEEEGESKVREIGEECEHLDDFHRGEEGKDTASGDSDHVQQGEKLMSFEEFCGETFEVSPTFFETIIEESRISQARLEKAHEEFGKSLKLILLIMNEVVGKLEKEWKGNEEGDTLSKQKILRQKVQCEAE